MVDGISRGWLGERTRKSRRRVTRTDHRRARRLYHIANMAMLLDTHPERERMIYFARLYFEKKE